MTTAAYQRRQARHEIEKKILADLHETAWGKIARPAMVRAKARQMAHKAVAAGYARAKVVA